MLLLGDVCEARVDPGLVVLRDSGYTLLKDKKIGIASNPSGIFPDSLDHEVDVLHANKDLNVVAVFGPEHGFRGDKQAGSSEGYYIDAQTKLPVYDIYGQRGQALEDIIKKSGAEIMVCCFRVVFMF